MDLVNVVAEMEHIADIFYGFTKAQSAHRSKAWYEMLERIRARALQQQNTGLIAMAYYQLHSHLMGRLALELSPIEFLGALPDDGDVADFLRDVETNVRTTLQPCAGHAHSGDGRV